MFRIRFTITYGLDETMPAPYEATADVSRYLRTGRRKRPALRFCGL
jgi:hypothetical protein